MCASLARCADIVIVRHPSFNRQRAVEVFTQAGPENFARAFIQARRSERGLDIAPDRSQLRLQIFVGVLGTHQGKNLVGIPSFAVPLIGLPTSEIALLKWLRNRGMVEIQIYAFDASSGAFAQKTPLSIGQSKQDDYTLLLVISFTISDLEEREPPPS